MDIFTPSHSSTGIKDSYSNANKITKVKSMTGSIFILLVAIITFWSAFSNAAVKITTDLTNAGNKKGKIHNYWDVRNEIPPYPSLSLPEQSPKQDSNNLIRLLGGEMQAGQKITTDDAVIYKEGKNLSVTDGYVQADGAYIYRFWKVRSRIDAVMKQGYEINQIVLDNPPWAFQRGLASGGTSTYGNSFPPGQPWVWAHFIEKLIDNLVAKYGYDVVSEWNFRVHTEADFIPHHWSGTKQDYFNHYKRTVNAVRKVIPTAKVGSHFLPPPSGSERYGVEFVNWTAQQNLPLNHLGISYYPFYNNLAHIDMDRVWDKFIKPFTTASGWKAGTKFGIPEFALFTEKDDDGFNVTVGTSHKEAFNAMMSKMILEKGVSKVHTWGDQTKDPFFRAIQSMAGKDRYKNWRAGDPLRSGNIVDGYFATSGDKNKIDAVVFNYNANPAYIADDKIDLVITVPFAPGTKFNYRSAYKKRSNNPHRQFTQQYVKATQYVSEGGWVLDKVRPDATTKTDKNGDLNTILNTAGKNQWNQVKASLSGYQTLPFSNNVEITAVQLGTSTTKSQIKVSVPLASFSFRKLEFSKK
ncbi:MAG: GH39 family glycosyl hydrolase [Thalassotalea sp.]